MIDPGKTAAFIGLVFASARYSLERSIRIKPETEEIEFAADAAGRIEIMRFPMINIARRSPSRYGPDDFTKSIDLVGNSLSIALEDKKFRVATERARFRLQPSGREFDDPEILAKYAEIFSNERSVFDVLNILIRYLAEIRSDDYIKRMFENRDGDLFLDKVEGNTEITIRALKNIVPEQKIAPVQFEIEKDRITIDRKPSSAERGDEGNIENAKQKILEDGNDIISKLKSSNCDKRLIENIEALQQSIQLNENAVRVGVNNISFGIISAVFKDELPEAINASLQSHNISVNMYVSQFPDWVRFSENALSAEITTEDVVSARRGAIKVIEYLEDNPDIAEPGVKQAFSNLAKTLENPSQTSKKATFAVIRTAENLFSKVFHYAIEYFEKLSIDTAKEIHKVAAKSIAFAMVGLALNGAAELTGISAHIKELSWLKNAIEIVEKQIKNPPSH